MQITTEYQPYHPSLRSLQQAQNDYSQILSDHVPYLATIPLAENAELPEVKVVSWNVMHRDIVNGYGNPNATRIEEITFGETPEQTEARHNLIADALVKFIQINQPHFITLQEITADNIDRQLYDIIQKKFKESGLTYQPVIVSDDIVQGGGNITLYDPTQFEPVIPEKVKTAKKLRNFELNASKIQFKSLKDKEELKVTITNSHPLFNAHPKEHENRIKKVLSDNDENSLSIVVGDFNCSVAPLDTTKKQNITTSAAPAFFRNGKLQGGDAIDGGFYAYKSKEIFHQATIQHLNPKTGQPYTPEELAALTDLLELQQAEVDRFRMVMCIDDSYNQNKLINDEYTIFEYQEHLRSQLNDVDILVRAARDLNNRSGIGIAINEELYKKFELMNNPKFQLSTFTDTLYNYEVGGITYYFIFAAKDAISELVNVMKPNVVELILKTQLAEFYKNIEALKPVHQDEESPLLPAYKNFQALYQALINEPEETKNIERSAIIIAHFNDLAIKFKNDPLANTPQNLEKSLEELNKKLYGKPPMGKALNATICGVIGAIAGFLFGVVIGAAIIARSDGFGAFIDAFEGAFTGFTLSTKIGLSVAGGVGLLSSLGGGFWAKRNQRKYEENKILEKTEIDDDVQTAMDNIMNPSTGS